MGNQLREIDRGLEILASFPEFRHLPVIIGESDPEGCAACPSSIYPENDYRNGTLYASYTASSFAKTYELTDRHGLGLVGATTWAFTFPDQPWFAGFRSLASNGVNKPVLNVFRMFGMMRGDRVAVANLDNPHTARAVIESGVRGGPDINALASKDPRSASVMVWNYHDEYVPAPDAEVTVRVEGVPAERVLLRHYRIDEEHGNAYRAWQEMGSPQEVTRDQRKVLERSAELTLLASPSWIEASEGTVTMSFTLPRHGVSLLELSW
jgi:xylan 1,4-beta-xylosidase